MKLLQRPVTVLIVLCLCSVCIGLTGAVVCHDKGEQCIENFTDGPQLSLCCVACLVVLAALFFAEFSGGRGGSAAGL